MTNTAKLMAENGEVWANLSDFSQSDDWILARWQPVAVPSEVMRLLTLHAEAVDEQLFSLVDDYEQALQGMKMFIAQEDGSCFTVREIQKGEDGIAIKR